MKIFVNSIIFLYTNIGVCIVLLVYLYTYNKKIHIQILTIILMIILAKYIIYPHFLFNKPLTTSLLNDFLFLIILKKALITFVIIKSLEYIYFTKKLMWNIPKIFFKLLKILLFICISFLIIISAVGNLYKTKHLERTIKNKHSIQNKDNLRLEYKYQQQ